MAQSQHAISLHYEETGQGLPVVLIHGFPFDHRIWQAQIAALGQDYRVIAPDLRGFGESPVPEDGYTMDRFAADVVALLDELNVDQAVWVGHSMGGYVSLAALRRWPERVRALALVASHARPDSDEKRIQRENSADQVELSGVSDVAFSMMGMVFADDVDRKGPLAQGVYDIMINSSATAVAGALRGMGQRPDSRDLLRELNVPAVVIAGDDDELIAPEVSQETAELLPQAELVVIEDAGHMPMVEQPDATTEALRRFLAAL